MVRSVVHPHKVSKWHRVTVVAIDLARTSLHLVAGTEDPKTSKVKKERRSGLVPKAHLDSVLAVTNGGWKSNHGRYGMRIGDDIFLPPREDACAILLSEDGLVEIGSWARLSERSEAMAAYRQAPPCLVDSGELHEDLVRRQVRRWGGLDPKRKTRRRSSLGIDASGRILFYGFGEEVDAMGLAEGMRHVGARSVALLDINYSWTRFLLVGQTSTDAPRRITSTLVPKMVHRKRGYVEQSMPRDFFYIRLRPSP